MGDISHLGDSGEWTTVLPRRKQEAKKKMKEGSQSFFNKMVLLLRCLHRRKSVPVFEQENPRFSSSLPCFSDESEFLHRVSLLELRVRDASNSGDGCSAVSSCTSPARSPGEQHIGGPQVLFSTLGPTDSDRRPRGNPGASCRGNAGAHGVRRLTFREILLVLAALKLGMFYLDLVVDNPVIQ